MYINKRLLIEAYQKYGFQEATSGDDNVCVFTLKAGHYHNADIVSFSQEGELNEERIFNSFKESGYACKVRRYANIAQVKETLFQGFFSVESTHKRFIREYNKFTKSIISVHSDNASYEYIHSHYHINGKKGESNVIDEIITRIDSETPILFLIEAAAGFGKTCSAYELLKEITNHHNNKVPLFTELSRNRQAKIFRYVLLDEIDRSFPLLSSNLVRVEIRNGNVPVILDGFDELLRQTEDSNSFDTSEPMLETIGELLTEKAKVILTTRRTSILDGDEFHQWMQRHEEEFKVIRIKIDSPTIENWLVPERLATLKKNGFPINNLCNPVLLSYLRCIPNDEFYEATKNPDTLVEKYFTSMLEREQTRQDLLIPPAEQYKVLKAISEDMMEYDYTAESKDYITSIVQDYYKNGKLEAIRKLYPVEDRPTSEELINKLTSHALLDRSNDESSSIGFINEFVLGNFCSEVILDSPNYEWCGSKIFIEPATLSYTPRSLIRRYSLWYAIQFSIEFCTPREKFINSIRLTNKMLMDIDSEMIDDLNVKEIQLFDESIIKNSVFVDCNFHNITFYLNNMDSISFVNCNFFDCITSGNNTANSIHVFGCTHNNNFLDVFENSIDIPLTEDEGSEFTDCDKYILEKFWPIGSSNAFKHRPAKALYIKNNKFSYQQTISSIEKLKKKKYISHADKNGIFEFDMDKASEIKSLLGR